MQPPPPPPPDTPGNLASREATNHLGNYVYRGTTFWPGSYLMSSNRRFIAVFQHDGNLVVYNTRNPLFATNTAGRGGAEYTYNGFRNRVRKLEDLSGLGDIPDPVSEARYTLDMTLPYDNLLMTDTKQPGMMNAARSFVWGNGLLSASGKQAEDKFYYLQDHLGSPIRLLGGDTHTPLAFDEFGVPAVQAGQNLNQPFGFTGYMSDSVSGMYYAQARFYAANLGRFNGAGYY